MSADSSCTMSAAVPPWKVVRSLSCTEFTSTVTIFTVMFGCAAFQSDTILLCASTVAFCQA